MSPARLAPELHQVLRGIAASRVPGFNFPGNFLEVTFDRVGPRASSLSLVPGAHCVGRDGRIDPSALCAFADIAIGTSIRAAVGRGARMATVQMSLQFPAPLGRGRLEARSTRDAFVAGTGGRQAMSRLEIRQGRRLVCTGSATFMVLAGGEATPPHPMPRRSAWRRVPSVSPRELVDGESAIFERAREALDRGGDAPFIARLFGFEPRRTASGASCRTPVGRHIGNRVGNVQGGILFGLATATAKSAAPEGWALVGASAWYTNPGTGDDLRTRSRVIHGGRSTAVVRTEIRDGHRRLVLTVISSHAATHHPHARESKCASSG